MSFKILSEDQLKREGIGVWKEENDNEHGPTSNKCQVHEAIRQSSAEQELILEFKTVEQDLGQRKRCNCWTDWKWWWE